MAFVDTNLFVYAVDSRDLSKQRTCSALLSSLAQQGRACVSSQVVMEFASNMVRKFGLSPKQVRLLLVGFQDFTVVPVTVATSDRALELMETCSLSYWDAAILSSAESAGCDILYSEDLSAGERYGAVKVLSPFS
ncbi:PIN domain-containing protein [Fimbriimonas ginsengisoli]|uniref:PIN domain-containing protein n=1 Tax=Fimbriimonas ginsengisoli TaxID=1005039 RepID=UPI00130EF728